MPPRTLPALLCALLAPLSCAAAGAEDFPLPAPGAPGAALKLWATHYFVRAAPAASNGVAFPDKAGAALSDPVSPRDWCLAAIEGTVRVALNGQPRTLNYAGKGATARVDCAAVLAIDATKKPWIASTGKSYFSAATGAFGDGVKGYRLVPLRTVAVDPAVIPFGSVLYLPGARGVQVTLPSGQKAKHDGYFFAGDTGGAIKGRHIDVFCGVSPANCLPGLIGSTETATFDAHLVTDPAVVESLTALHRH